MSATARVNSSRLEIAQQLVITENSSRLEIGQQLVITELIIERDEARVQEASAWECTLRLEVANFKLRQDLAAAQAKIKNQKGRIWDLKSAVIKAAIKGGAK